MPHLGLHPKCQGGEWQDGASQKWPRDLCRGILSIVYNQHHLRVRVGQLGDTPLGLQIHSLTASSLYIGSGYEKASRVLRDYVGHVRRLEVPAIKT